MTFDEGRQTFGHVPRKSAIFMLKQLACWKKDGALRRREECAKIAIIGANWHALLEACRSSPESRDSFRNAFRPAYNLGKHYPPAFDEHHA